jgi:hypothetical protein
MSDMAIKYPGRFVWFMLTSVVDGTRGLCQITKMEAYNWLNITKPDKNVEWGGEEESP